MEWFLKHMLALKNHWFVVKMIKKDVEAEIAMFDHFQWVMICQELFDENKGWVMNCKDCTDIIICAHFDQVLVLFGIMVTTCNQWLMLGGKSYPWPISLGVENVLRSYSTLDNNSFMKVIWSVAWSMD